MFALEIEKNDFSSHKPDEQDDLMDITGGEGFWQRYVFVVAAMCSFQSVSHNMVMSFFAPNLDHWCSRPTGVNISVDVWKAIAIPPDDVHCSRYKFLNYTSIQEDHSQNMTSKEKFLCDSWEYDYSMYKSTVRSQWNLVCNREWFISLSKSVYMAGYFLSATLFGYCADKFGRRSIIPICNAIALVSAVTSIFSTSFLMFAVTRFFLAVGVTGLESITCVLMMEIISPKYRPAYGVGVNIGWVLGGYLWLPGIAWIFRHWIHMQIAMTLPFVLLLSTWWLFPESPRWLLVQGETVRAERILSKAAKRNRFDICINEFKEVISKSTKCSYEAENVKVNILQLFKPGMWQNTIIIIFIWFTNGFIYYGISYNTNELAGDPFLNFILFGIVEIPAYITTFFLIQIKGRRIPQAMTCLAAGLSCLLIYPIPKDPWWMSEIMSLFGKFCITCSFSTLYVFSTEIFPTTLRNVGMGLAQICARSGAIIAPFVKEIGKSSHPIVPQLIFGSLAAIAGLLALSLPETKNSSIPDTIRESVHVSRKETDKN